MADGVRVDPYRGFNYKVLVAGKFAGELAFQKVSGLETEIEVTEYRDGADTATTRKLPGLAKFPNVVLERGITDNVDMAKWLQEIVNLTLESGLAADGDFRAEVTIELINRQKETVREWTLTSAWPCKLTIGDFDGTSSDVIIESMELCHEGLTLVSAA